MTSTGDPLAETKAFCPTQEALRRIQEDVYPTKAASDRLFGRHKRRWLTDKALTGVGRPWLTHDVVWCI